MKIDFEKAWTIKEFAAEFGYSEEYVRQCCREHPDFRTGTPVSLPRGWKAHKVGRVWFLVPKNRQATRKLKRSKR